MGALSGLLIVTGVLYGLFVDFTFWKIFAAVVTLYFIFIMLYRNKRDNGKRKTILISTWGSK